MSSETDIDPELQPFFELPGDLIDAEHELEFELDCGLFADQITTLTPQVVTFRAFERLGYAETLDAYQARRDELTDGYAHKTRLGPNDVIYHDDNDAKQPSDRRDKWYQTEGQTTYYEDEAERIDTVVARDVYLYERYWFDNSLETVADLARELSRITGASLSEADLAERVDVP